MRTELEAQRALRDYLGKLGHKPPLRYNKFWVVFNEDGEIIKHAEPSRAFYKGVHDGFEATYDRITTYSLKLTFVGFDNYWHARAYSLFVKQLWDEGIDVNWH